MATPAFTRSPGGFITAVPLPDGRVLVEGWAFNPSPFDGGQPRHEVAYHWVAETEAEALDTVREFSGHLAEPISV